MYGISDVSDIGIGIGIGYPIFHLEKIGYRYRVRISYRPSPGQYMERGDSKERVNISRYGTARRVNTWREVTARRESIHGER